jgi:hypothetical protein
MRAIKNSTHFLSGDNSYRLRAEYCAHTHLETQTIFVFIWIRSEACDINKYSYKRGTPSNA